MEISVNETKETPNINNFNTSIIINIDEKIRKYTN